MRSVGKEILEEEYKSDPVINGLRDKIAVEASMAELRGFFKEGAFFSDRIYSIASIIKVCLWEIEIETYTKNRHPEIYKEIYGYQEEGVVRNIEGGVPFIGPLKLKWSWLLQRNTNVKVGNTLLVHPDDVYRFCFFGNSVSKAAIDLAGDVARAKLAEWVDQRR